MDAKPGRPLATLRRRLRVFENRVKEIICCPKYDNGTCMQRRKFNLEL